MNVSTWKRGLTRFYVLVWVLWATAATAGLFPLGQFHRDVPAPRNASASPAPDSVAHDSTEWSLPAPVPTVRVFAVPVVPLLAWAGVALVGPAVLLLLLRWVFDGFTRERHA
jgi:hypothetical protein